VISCQQPSNSRYEAAQRNDQGNVLIHKGINFTRLSSPKKQDPGMAIGWMDGIWMYGKREASNIMILMAFSVTCLLACSLHFDIYFIAEER
jgi:hypothetical protein